METRNCPWGDIQHSEVVAPGIIHVSTAGHGGYKISKERMLEIEKRFASFSPFAGATWLEEDEDWAFAVVTWPKLWENTDVVAAVTSIKRSYGGIHFPDLQKNCPEAMKIFNESEVEA
jgi:hypothetical protein